MNLIVLALLLSGPVEPSPEPRILSPEAQLRTIDTIGSCEGSGGSIDLRRVMFLENRSIVIDGSQGPLRISVERDDFLVEEIGEGSQHRQYYNDIGNEVDESGELDIELKLASVEGRLVLYWKETFQNRIYRQGIFSINPSGFFLATEESLTPLCEGRGGSNSER